MFVNPGRIRPWEWLVLLNYLNEPALAMALVVKHRHTGTCTGTNHLPSPRSSRKASQENSCQSFGHLPALTDSLLRGRKRQRQSCQRIRNHSFSFRGKFWAQAFVHCFSLQILCCTRTYLTNSKQAQSCSSRDTCQGVTLWYNHLSSSFVSFYCAVTWKLVSHFWAMTFFPFILWS